MSIEEIDGALVVAATHEPTRFQCLLSASITGASIATLASFFIPWTPRLVLGVIAGWAGFFFAHRARV